MLRLSTVQIFKDGKVITLRIPCNEYCSQSPEDAEAVLLHCSGPHGKGGVSGTLPRDPISVDIRTIMKSSIDGHFSPDGQK